MTGIEDYFRTASQQLANVLEAEKGAMRCDMEEVHLMSVGGFDAKRNVTLTKQSRT